MGLVVCTLVISAAAANAGVPSLTLSTATTAAGAQVTVYNLPNGNGDPFTEARLQGGGTTDATITLELLDGNGDPIPNYPFEDLYLDSTSEDFFACANGTTADFNTDENGITTWSNPLLAGGYTDPTAPDLVQVFVNGAPLAGPGMNIQFNSPDITGDGAFTLGDLQAYADDFFNVGYAFRSDFNWDNALTLGDLQLLAAGQGANCP